MEGTGKGPSITVRDSRNELGCRVAKAPGKPVPHRIGKKPGRQGKTAGFGRKGSLGLPDRSVN